MFIAVYESRLPGQPVHGRRVSSSTMRERLQQLSLGSQQDVTGHASLMLSGIIPASHPPCSI